MDYSNSIINIETFVNQQKEKLISNNAVDNIEKVVEVQEQAEDTKDNLSDG